MIHPDVECIIISIIIMRILSNLTALVWNVDGLLRTVQTCQGLINQDVEGSGDF